MAEPATVTLMNTSTMKQQFTRSLAITGVKLDKAPIKINYIKYIEVDDHNTIIHLFTNHV